eukprot:3184008-Pyramimonas_sp.AAC.1
MKALPDVDIAVGGAPCQPFAKGGSLKGMEDPRGRLVYKMVEYVEAKAKANLPLPRALLMEQSKTLKNKWSDVYDNIKSRLTKLGYRFKSTFVNTNLHGIPQSRERLYMVAYFKVHKFHFPEELKTTIPIEKMLHPMWQTDLKTTLVPTNAVARIDQARKEAADSGYNPDVDTVFVDLDSSERFWSWKVDESMTLTRRRCEGGGWFMTNRGRRQTVREMLAMQGIVP